MASSDNSDEKRQQFGNRYLTDPESVFQHNAWDNVVWDAEQEREAREKTQQQLAEALPEEDRGVPNAKVTPTRGGVVSEDGEGSHKGDRPTRVTRVLKLNKIVCSSKPLEMYEEKASQFWDEFYNIHTNRFFKDRHWLFVEFPELYSSNKKKEPQETVSENKDDLNQTQTDGSVVSNESDKDGCERHSADKSGTVWREASEHSSDMKQVTEGVNELDPAERLRERENYPGENAKFRYLEVGCGVGNTVFPVLQTNNDPNLMVYCCDFSSTAIQIVKDHQDYSPSRCHAFVCDISDMTQDMPMQDGSLDVIIMIFVLSAINPDRMQSVIDRLARLLKPGGKLLFRDYGRYDLAQLRFKKGRCLSENFYVRGDGTRVYFFTQEELKSMFIKAGLDEVQNLIDRRLQVNRGKQLKMYRVWIQCKYQKPLTT